MIFSLALHVVHARVYIKAPVIRYTTCHSAMLAQKAET
jgi:hypothetical protein